MKKDKELIKEIVDQLKSKPDLAYREGAWERFNSQNGTTPVKTSSVSYLKKYLAAAALLLFGLAFSYYLLSDKSFNTGSANMISAITNNETDTSDLLVNEGLIVSPRVSEQNASVESFKQEANKRTQEQTLVSINQKQIDLDNFSDNITLVALAPVYSKDIIGEVELFKTDSKEKSQIVSDLAGKLVLANASMVNNLQKSNNLDESLSPKSFKFGEKFDLGLFVSPYSSNSNFKLGAGLTIAYNLSNKISIRTGASYNNYEVGILKNPLEASSVEQIKTEALDGIVHKDNNSFNSSMQTTTLILPNISAITGYVKSVDIPLEVKYNVGHSFYAVAGASYSTILSQERNAQYVENINYDTFSNGFPSDERAASKAMETVTKTVKSNEENVKASGFNGFLNFSIGKKINVNQKFGLSIEPYYKIPVGEFRNSDMNYNNGGVRIMTNF